MAPPDKEAEHGVEDIRAHLLEQGTVVGSLLWHSVRGDLKLNFDELEAKEYLDRRLLRVDDGKLVNHVRNRSHRHDLTSEALTAGIAERRAAGGDPWQIARGHDMVEILVFALRFVWGNHTTLKRDDLEKRLRVAFPPEEFDGTHLCGQVREWERRNAPFAVLQTA